MANITRDAHPTLEVEGLTKQFRGMVAVDGVTFRVSKNTVHGLIGPNGAGKTTVFNMISGVLPATAGAICLLGEPLDECPPGSVPSAASRAPSRTSACSAI